MLRVLFVCTGNLCRSPMAQGMLMQRLTEAGLDQDIRVDSAATHGYRLNEAPAAFAIAVASHRGIDLRHLRSRLINREDFFSADIIVAMDEANLRALRAQAPASQTHKLHLLLDFAECRDTVDRRREIADPYGQPLIAFEAACKLIDEGVTGLFEKLRGRL